MKHEIEIPDLPEGWEAVAYRPAIQGVDYVLRNGAVTIYNGFSDTENLLIVRKKQPRRIILEETGEIRLPGYKLKIDDGYINMPAGREYKIVEDNKCAE